MTLSQAPMFFLEAPAIPARRPQHMRIHWFDYAFFTIALIGICGGALILLELASLQGTGHGSFVTRFMVEMNAWLPVITQKLATYGILFLASVVNSAVMVLFVHVLRMMDRRFSRSRQRRWPAASYQVPVMKSEGYLPRAGQQSGSPLNRNAFLLSPIIR